MRKKIGLLLVIVALLVSGCGLMSGPSVCDDTTEASVLCDLSLKAGVRLENVGNMLIIVNAIAIGEGAYSKQDALHALEGLREFIDSSVSYVLVKSKALEIVDKYPGLFTLTELYLQGFDSTSLLSAKDQRILTTWLDNRIRSLK